MRLADYKGINGANIPYAILVDENGSPVTVAGAGGAVVADGEDTTILEAVGQGILAVGTVAVASGNFDGVRLGANSTVIQDGADNIYVLDYGAGGGQVAGIARVSNNAGSVQLANSTTKIAINAAPAQVTAGSKTVGITLAVDQGAWQPFPLVNVTDAILSDGDSVDVTAPDGSVPATVTIANNAVSEVGLTPATATIITDGMTSQIPVTGTYTDSVTFTVAGGVITAIALN